MCSQNTEAPVTAGARVQPVRRSAWDNLSLCSNPKGTPSCAREKDLGGHPIRLGGWCMKEILVPSPAGGSAMGGSHDHHAPGCCIQVKGLQECCTP